MIRKPAFGKHDLSIFFDDQDQRSTSSVIDRKGKYTQKRLGKALSPEVI